MGERRTTAPAKRGGQATFEFALACGGVVFPALFALIFTSQLLWVWHSVNEFTRLGASYAATHCWQGSGGNVVDFMRSNVPPVISGDQFQNGPAEINVSYFARDPNSGQLQPFECDGDCSTNCIPDAVTITVTGYEYRPFVTSLGLPPVVLPNFQASLPIESAGCDPEQGICLP